MAKKHKDLFEEEDKVEAPPPMSIWETEKTPEEKYKKSFVPKEPNRKVLVGKVLLVTPSKVIILHDGNGVWIPYVEEKHSKLKEGDPIEFTS